VNKIVECVPNFSEGRRKDVVASLSAALSSVPGVALLDSEMDAAHNRCVITVAGDPEGVAEGVVRAVGKAIELIDLRHHQGEHPRMGAADVIPFVPIAGMDMEQCVELSVRVATEIAHHYNLPVYLYEQSARVPARQDLAYVRKGEFEAIRDEIGTVPERKPDFGPAQVHPSAGATAVGARFPLIAYNIYLNSTDLRIAQAIARAIRNASGGLRYVKALGFEISDRKQVQVSINLTNFEATPLFRVFDMVVREAERYGATVASSEIVGLVPQKALDSCADYYLRLEGFSRSQILENRLEQALASGPSLDEWVASVAAPDAVPGGGSVSALAGALAAALGEMVCGLTENRDKYKAVEHTVRQLHARLSEARRVLEDLVREDSAAYLEVMNALKLPREAEQQKAQRTEALQRATRRATETPLCTLRTAVDVLGACRSVAQIGNINARSDAAVGAQLAFAAAKGAQYNVLINLPGLKDEAFVERSRTECLRLAAEARQILHAVDELMTGSPA
jgi:glutamate formiminotransferase / formiminotetrahydrofolate cyclodeaminase